MFYLRFIAPYHKMFLLEEVGAQEIVVHFDLYNYVERWRFRNLPCIALLRCTCVLGALEMGPSAMIYNSQILYRVGTLSSEYFWLKAKVLSILNWHFESTWEISIFKITFSAIRNGIL